MNRKEVLQKAERCITGKRNEDHGKPENTFQAMADLWGAYIKNKCCDKNGVFLGLKAEDSANLQSLFKMARICCGQAKEDSYVDYIGYGACAAEIATKQHDSVVAEITTEKERLLTTALDMKCVYCCDGDCKKCPIGKESDIQQISCLQYIENNPQQAIEIMRGGVSE